MHPDSRISIIPVAAVMVCMPAHSLVYMSVEEAQQVMFRGQTLTAMPVVLSAADMAAIERDSGVRVYPGSLRAWKADDGYFFVDDVIGKHDLITYAVALTGTARYAKRKYSSIARPMEARCAMRTGARSSPAGNMATPCASVATFKTSAAPPCRANTSPTVFGGCLRPMPSPSPNR